MLSRRRFIARGAAAVAAAGIAPLGFARTGGDGGSRRVVVIGAGLAGLSAAFELEAAGYDVTVFEARARAGGRVRTLREPFADGLTAEAGAMVIASHHDLTLHYARLFELPLIPGARPEGAAVAVLRGRRLVLRRGEPGDWPVALTAEERALGAAGMLERYWGREVEAAAGVEHPGWPPASLLPLDALSLADLWRRNGASEGAVEVLRLGYLDLVGEGVDSYSALYGVREAAFRVPTRDHYRIEGGNDRLPLAFAARLAGRIHYGTAAVRIAHGPDRVTVTVRDAAGTHEVAADRVVCAIPFPLLREIAVEPQFSEGKARAIRELPNTSVTRVYLQCRTRFWEAEGLTGSARTDLPISSFYPVMGNPPGPRGLIEVFTVGDRARALAAMAPAERLAFVVAQAGAVFPALSAQFEGGASFCWDDEPWAKGAYPWYKPGQMAELLPHLAGPEGRVHFAGDQTTTTPGWMQGALASGRRAAAEIAAG